MQIGSEQKANTSNKDLRKKRGKVLGMTGGFKNHENKKNMMTTMIVFLGEKR